MTLFERWALKIMRFRLKRLHEWYRKNPDNPKVEAFCRNLLTELEEFMDKLEAGQ
jgi:hypothetical protein